MNNDKTRHWYDNPDPYPWIPILCGLALLAGWGAATHWWLWEGSWRTNSGISIPVTYAWFVVLGGGLGTWAFMEGDRWLYGHDWLLPMADRENNPPRASTRIEPAVTGLIERILLTTLGIFVLTAAPDSVIPLGAIGGGYVVLKSFKRFVASEKPVITSIHSLWGSMISVSFAFLGAWWLTEKALATTSP